MLFWDRHWKGPGMAYRLIIDYTKCENNGRCIELASELVQPGGDGDPVVLRTLFDAEHETVARLAVKGCPMGALRIEAAADP
jgi:ferredoxin